MPGEDTAVRLADALDYEPGGRRLVELAERLGRSEAVVRQRASRLRLRRLEVPENGRANSAGGPTGWSG